MNRMLYYINKKYEKTWKYFVLSLQDFYIKNCEKLHLENEKFG